jgi:hypothetical protein
MQGVKEMVGGAGWGEEIVTGMICACGTVVVEAVWMRYVPRYRLLERKRSRIPVQLF